MHDLDGPRAVLDGDLLTSASPGYAAARRPALARFRELLPAGRLTRLEECMSRLVLYMSMSLDGFIPARTTEWTADSR